MWKRIALAGVTLGTVCGMAVAGASPASADSGQIWFNNAGYGQFISYGDHFYACDRKSDGYGIQVDFSVPGGTAGWLRDINGNNGDCTHVNTNLGEYKTVYLRTCITDNGVELGCTEWYPTSTT